MKRRAKAFMWAWCALLAMWLIASWPALVGK